MKRFLVCVICALTVIGVSAFSGCSVDYTVIGEGCSKSGNYIDYHLILKIKPGEYNFKYTVYCDDVDGNVIEEFVRYETLTVRENERAELKYSFLNKNDVNVYKVWCDNVKISPVLKDNGVILYAVVGGTVSAVILAGLVTLFVLDKKGKLKK